MPPEFYLPPIPTTAIEAMPAPQETPAQQLMRLAQRDFEKVWNGLVARATMAESETVKFEAGKLLMLYIAGPPPDMPTGAPGVVGSGAMPMARATDLAGYTLDELNAIRTLQLAAQRRKRDAE